VPGAEAHRHERRAAGSSIFKPWRAKMWAGESDWIIRYAEGGFSALSAEDLAADYEAAEL
jgi:hypothetical protein